MMWYASPMPSVLPADDIRRAFIAVDYARQVRRVNRRRTQKGDPQRESDLDLALERLQAAMVPIRRHVGKFPYGPEGDEASENRASIREASQAMQAERRKLWKMKQRREE